MKYLVIGGAGRTGTRVAAELAQNGHEVIIASRYAGPLTVDLAQDIDPAILDGVDGVVVSVEPPADEAGANATLNHGVARLAQAAAETETHVVLLSQIYITRAAEHPDMAGIIRRTRSCGRAGSPTVPRPASGSSRATPATARSAAPLLPRPRPRRWTSPRPAARPSSSTTIPPPASPTGPPSIHNAIYP